MPTLRLKVSFLITVLAESTGLVYSTMLLPMQLRSSARVPDRTLLVECLCSSLEPHATVALQCSIPQNSPSFCLLLLYYVLSKFVHPAPRPCGIVAGPTAAVVIHKAPPEDLLRNPA